MNKKLNVLLIQYPLEKRIYAHPRLIYPLGLSYISAALRGHNVELFDANIHKNHQARLKSLIKEFKPDILGVSIRVLEQTNEKILYGLKSYFNYIKSLAPRSLICAGGCGFSLSAQRIMEEVREIDFGVFSDGVESFPELLNNLDKAGDVKGVFFRKSGEVVFSGARVATGKRNALSPKRELDLKQYISSPFSIGVSTKIGCVFNCSYCSYRFLDGNSIFLRPPQDVLDEIKSLIDSGVDQFFFTDSVFNFPVDQAKEICSGMIKNKLNIKWKAYLHLNYMDSGFAGLMKEAGCREFIFSPDGFSRRTLKVLQKGFSVKDITRSYDTVSKIEGVKIHYCFIFNSPFETAKDLVDLLRLSLKLKHAQICLLELSMPPFTGIHDMAKKSKLKLTNPDRLTGCISCKKDFFYYLMLNFIRLFLAINSFSKKSGYHLSEISPDIRNVNN